MPALSASIAMSGLGQKAAVPRLPRRVCFYPILFSNSGSGCQVLQRSSLPGPLFSPLAVQCCNRGRPFRRAQKNRSNSPSPSSRQGRRFPPFGRISVFFLLSSNLLLRPVELGPVDPHAMQNDRELTSNRYLGLAEPVALCELRPPSLHGGPFRDAGQQNPGCFK